MDSQLNEIVNMSSEKQYDSKIQQYAKRPQLDIEFQDLSYSIRGGGKRQIITNVSGIFRPGELTGILGPSGAGKSTLMNILAGYVTSGVSGVIKTNGCQRDIKYFNKLSTYIMQDDLLQPRLHVHEAMEIAANLKLGAEVNREQKLEIIDEILNNLGLFKCKNTRTERLSGGQRKRLSIALELVNNPPVIFLDEPTSGLDISTTKQLVRLLKFLARQGRTIVCTIHQPTASVFELFDQVYFLARGHCVYNGSTNQLVPFLSSAGLSCPTTHNPADFIIELVHSDIDCVRILSNEIQNGRTNRKSEPPNDMYRYFNCQTQEFMENVCHVRADVQFATSFWTQFSILVRRMSLQIARNHSMLWIQLAHHVISAGLVGGIFYGVGNDAAHGLTNFKFCLCNLFFFMYTYIMVPVLIFPNEIKLLKREYFNRWYGLKSFYTAWTVANTPLLVILSIVFVSITYFSTNQPMILDRFLWFVLFGIMLGLCSQGLGLAIGSFFSVTNGSIVSPACITPLLALAAYGMGFGEAIEPSMRFLMAFSYLRYGIVGFTETLFGHNRTNLDCRSDEFYCHYTNPKILIRDLGMKESSYVNQMYGIFAFIVFYRFVAYCGLRYRLTAEFSNKILNYVAKMMRRK